MDADELMKKTVKQLKALTLKHKIAVPSTALKADLVKILAGNVPAKAAAADKPKKAAGSSKDGTKKVAVANSGTDEDVESPEEDQSASGLLLRPRRAAAQKPAAPAPAQKPAAAATKNKDTAAAAVKKPTAEVLFVVYVCHNNQPTMDSIHESVDNANKRVKIIYNQNPFKISPAELAAVSSDAELEYGLIAMEAVNNPGKFSVIADPVDLMSTSQLKSIFTPVVPDEDKENDVPNDGSETLSDVGEENDEEGSASETESC
jgi:hypothetical protein